MSDLFDFDQPPPLYAVMGNPVAHSRSPEIHQLFAQQASIKIDYQRLQVDVGGFAQAVSNFQASGGQGLNVTVPFKVEAWELTDTCSERAELARAVNTLWFEANAINGDNTDGVGIVRDINNNLQRPINHTRLLVLGAGGAVRGVLGELLRCQPSQVVVANRTVDKAVELADTFQNHSNAEILGCGFGELEEMHFDIIINGTAASLTGEVPPIPKIHFGDGALAYDMVYSTKPTAFMRWATGTGIPHVSDGLGMLVEQAAESFYIWHGYRPSTEPVIRALRSGTATEDGL
ncbi:MAG: shikimate dehydrogenase [Arenicellales bacterium]|nr:shikimate dehydrogenase [Arenicellales bacterium]